MTGERVFALIYSSWSSSLFLIYFKTDISHKRMKKENEKLKRYQIAKEKRKPSRSTKKKQNLRTEFWILELKWMYNHYNAMPECFSTSSILFFSQYPFMMFIHLRYYYLEICLDFFCRFKIVTSSLSATLTIHPFHHIHFRSFFLAAFTPLFTKKLLD